MYSPCVHKVIVQARERDQSGGPGQQPAPRCPLLCKERNLRPSTPRWAVPQGTKNESLRIVLLLSSRCSRKMLCFPPPPSALVKERRKMELLAATSTFPALGTPAPEPAALPHVLQPGLLAVCFWCYPGKAPRSSQALHLAWAKPFPKETLKGLRRNKAKRACNYLELGSG